MSRSLASFFRQVFLKEPSETSIKFKNKKCQNNLKNLNSSFDKTPGHFGSGFVPSNAVHMAAIVAGRMAAWSNADADYGQKACF